MPKTSEATTARRRSSRNKAKALETSKVLEINEEEFRMPAGYNPSDDSEDEYVPPTFNKKSKNQRNRKRRAASDDSSDDDDDVENVPPPSKRSKKQIASTPRRSSKKFPEEAAVSATKKTSSTPARSSSSSRTSKGNKSDPKNNNNMIKVKSEPGSENFFCPFSNCKQMLKKSDLIHIAIHYYDQNKFSTLNILKPDDPDLNGRAKDEKGKRYKCEFHGCIIKRLMGFKEMFVHLATYHQKLRNLMEHDATPAIKQILSFLYPTEVKSPAKIKKEVVASLPEENGNSEEEDDPTVHAPTKPQKSSSSLSKPLTTSIPLTPRATQPAPISSVSRPKVDKMMNCFLCKNKDGKNLNTGANDLKYHISVCVYLTGGFLKYLPHGQACDKNAGLSDIEEYGAKYKYKCPFENCDKGTAKAKAIGFKELAIHCGVMHGILERWAENSDKEEAKELYELLKFQREEDGKVLGNVPHIPFEEVHTCCICKGQDKEGKNLSFSKEKIYQTRYHYAACVYDSELGLNYLQMYPPGKQNVTEDGKPKDVLGREVKYSCQEKGCKNKRKMGYKEFCIHMSNDHGGLEEVLAKCDDEKIREIAPKLKVMKR